MSSGRDVVRALLEAMPEPAGFDFRFGVVRSVTPLRVEVGATGVSVPVASLVLGYTLAAGDGVALVRVGSQLMVLGKYVAAS